MKPLTHDELLALPFPKLKAIYEAAQSSGDMKEADRLRWAIHNHKDKHALTEDEKKEREEIVKVALRK